MSNKQQKQMRLSPDTVYLLDTCKAQTGWTHTKITEMCIAMFARLVCKEILHADQMLVKTLLNLEVETVGMDEPMFWKIADAEVAIEDLQIVSIERRGSETFIETTDGRIRRIRCTAEKHLDLVNRYRQSRQNQNNQNTK